MIQTNNNPSDIKKPKLLDQVRYVLRVKHDGLSTEISYVDWIQGVRYFINLIIIDFKHYFSNIKIIANKKSFYLPLKDLSYFIISDIRKKWDKEKQVWICPYKEVVKLGLVARIIDGKK